MKLKLKVDGMSCSHCEKAVKTAWEEFKEVTQVKVNLAEKNVEVTGTDLNAEKLAVAVEDQGYEMRGIEELKKTRAVS